MAQNKRVVLARELLSSSVRTKVEHGPVSVITLEGILEDRVIIEYDVYKKIRGRKVKTSRKGQMIISKKFIEKREKEE